MAARARCRCGWTKRYETSARAEFNARRHVCKLDDGVRRATRRYRCARCGLTAVYENAGAAEARYWFGKHSCRKHEMAALRATQAQQVRDLVDRSPRPCLHKVARHEHGNYATYVLDKCRCVPCSSANSAYEQNRVRQIAYGRWNQRVPAGPVREHVRSLTAAGMGLKRVAKVSGVAHGALWKLMYGKRRPDGTRVPSRRVTRETAEKLYAIDPSWSGELLPLADGAMVAAHGTVLRMRALVTLGWSQSKLASRLGVERSNFRLATGTMTITVRTRDAAARLYDELSMTLPPAGNQRDRISVSRARNYAAERGWLPPLALDDDRLDDPGYEPWVEYPESSEAIAS